MTQEELNKVLEAHKHYLAQDREGWDSMRANLRWAYLGGADLTGVKYNGDKVVGNNYIDTIYKVGEIVHPDSWDDNRWNECSNGIHFFITRDEAVGY